MSVTKLVEYLEEQHGVRVCPQTIRNWRAKGRRGVKLPAGASPVQVKNFLAQTGPTFGRGRPSKKVPE
jgi:hypothetical protein